MKEQKLTRFVTREDADRKWRVVDAEGKTLGRLASEIAMTIRGKRKPTFTPNADTGDFVVVVNADKVALTGKRAELKYYLRHSGYPGGQRRTTIKEVFEKKPEFVVRHAVWGMLPKNRLGRKLIKKLKVYASPEHPHAAQKPEPLEIQG